MIETRSIGELVRGHGLFADAPQVADFLATCARTASFRDGELILREGEPVDRFLLLRSGRAALETHVPGRGGAVVETVGEGDPLGLSWLVPPYLSDFDARAIGTVHALAFDAACLREKCERDHSIGYAFYRLLLPAMVGRLRTARIKTLDLHAGAAGGKGV